MGLYLNAFVNTITINILYLLNATLILGINNHNLSQLIVFPYFNVY